MEMLVRVISTLYPDQEIIFQNANPTFSFDHFSNVYLRDFIENEDLKGLIDKSCFIVCHGGTGIIIEALSAQKRVFVLPREKRFREHIDDHQFEIANAFAGLHYIRLLDPVTPVEQIKEQIEQFQPKLWTGSNQKLGEYIRKKYVQPSTS